MGAEIPTGAAAELLAKLRDQMARNEKDRRLRDHARYAIAGTMLTDGSLNVKDSALIELRATLQGDDQRLFDPAVLKLDGWTQHTECELVWKGPKTSPPAPNPQALPNSASPAERDWVQYLEKMSDPKEWAKRKRRRAFVIGLHFSAWCRQQDTVALAERAGPNEKVLFDETLMKDDKWPD